MKWQEFLFSVPHAVAEGVAEAILPLCHGGVAQEPALTATPGSEEVALATDRPTAVRAYLPRSADFAPRRRALLQAAQAACPELSLSERELDEEDWASAWKRHFTAARVGRRLVIKPTWERYEPRRRDVVIELDPGMAFGTGDHPTTRACLRALERLILPGDRVLDLGTGSGILAIAAARLGASAVLAVDVDPIAVEAARANCVSNGVATVVTVVLGGVEARHACGSPPVDLALANLTSQLHRELAADLLEAVRPGGHVVAAGVGAPALRQVARAYRRAGAARSTIRRDGEWRALILRKAE
ncbi:MAG: 50S ribosomal protein L11 methyltransferase [Chloroflexi bacterium]|nr:50S ribosomal protein L11 methyltransferase [Chloroflexota bacterium]